MSDSETLFSAGGVELLFLCLDRKHIAFVKFVLESYEGVAVLRTLDPQTAVIVVMMPPDQAPLGRAVIDSLRCRITMEEIAPPADLDGDWLLGELKIDPR